MKHQQQTDYLDHWWEGKLTQNYTTQPKHLGAGELLEKEHFPLVDLGCGPGVFLKHLEECFPGENLFGLEISNTAIENKICASPVERGEVQSWAPTTKVTTISLIDVIEHIPDPGPLLTRLSTIADYFLLACPNFHYFQARIDVALGRIPFQNRVARGGHVYWCEYNSLIELCRGCGLEVIKSNHLYPKHQWKWLRRILGCKPSLFAHEFVFLLKRKGLND